ncbi:DUF1566 domain-containing protein [Thalassotalea sp. PLHSN55]|uniref:Lcl C-terminal domain-containing protein n=1 Tax=Thalassotalea sp. PLHSN55 TaxID=3435888 RepID=UPI003F82A892
MIKRAALILLMIVFLVYFSREQLTDPQPQTSHWVKINALGQPIANWSGPWACVLDTNTGLVWENKNDSEGIHDGYWTYSWFDVTANNGQGLGVENWGDCLFEKDRCDSQDLIKRMNQEKTCGLTQWRLPTAKELATLVIDYQQAGEPVIDMQFFPQTKRGDYWTADAQQPLTGFYQYLGQGAVAVNFITGEQVVTPYRNAAFVRLVSSEKLP